MNMGEQIAEQVDLLDSPLWQYLTRAATEKFSYLEQASYMQAHLEWEKQHEEVKKILEDSKLTRNFPKSSVRRAV